ncbi:MAG: BspA family leucine-rich repeat surface protein [Prevotella sp.]|nr:BspA family leucine-rich repeat surface protein [Prevotella sp.]
MLFMLLLLPTRMVAQTTNDEPVTFTALEGNPEGVSEAENFKKLFDGKKTIDDFSKWCCKFSGSAYVIFEASKAGVPVGYTITTGNDNANWGCSGRNPLSWKLYGNNEGKNGVWTLIQEVENDDKLEDKNYTSYDFTCEGSTSYKYFKWEISAIHSGNTLQVGEFELKLNTCSHKNANGSDALGAVIETVDPTCAEHGYTTHECSLCHSTVKVYKDDELKAHTLTHHEATSDIKEHWQCDVCRKYFSDSNATQEVTYGSLLFDQAYAMFDDATETLTFSYGTKPEGAYALNQERPEPEWRMQKIRTVVFDASFAYARPTSCSHWFEDCIYLTRIKGIWNLKTKNVTDMSSMFLGCSSLRSLDLTNFDTGNVTDMSKMFLGCRNLTSLDVSKFNTSKVTDMCCMFVGCHKLTSLNVSKFNTTEVTDMSDMFEDCYALTSLDLTNFDTGKVKDMLFMFYGCSALTTIYTSDKFVTDKVTDNGSKMFYGCKNLKGANEYQSGQDGIEYANYQTGYFTNLVGKNGDEKIGAVGETLTAENLTLNDDKDFVAYEPFTATTATYNRTMKEGTTWATLCLPFEVSLEGMNFRAFKLLSADEGAETVELEEVKTIEAGTPVIIKMKDGVNSFSFSVENTAIAKDVQTAATADGNYQLQGLYTQKEFSKDADNNCYIVKDNKLMNPAKLLENTKVTRVASKPFRAYMVDNSSSAAGAKMFSIGISDSTTAIDSLNTIANDKAEYYDLQGKRLNEPQKGINIVKRGGKTMKVIIK